MVPGVVKTVYIHKHQKRYLILKKASNSALNRELVYPLNILWYPHSYNSRITLHTPALPPHLSPLPLPPLPIITLHTLTLPPHLSPSPPHSPPHHHTAHTDTPPSPVTLTVNVKVSLPASLVAVTKILATALENIQHGQPSTYYYSQQKAYYNNLKFFITLNDIHDIIGDIYVWVWHGLWCVTDLISWL